MPALFIRKGIATMGALCALLASVAIQAATTASRYYAHDAVLDRHGVIAPWYKGLNGQCDYRVRIAAETIKRYPWVPASDAVASAPHYMFNSRWHVCADGTIVPTQSSDFWNGDLGQRSGYVFLGLVRYYMYTGDPAAISHISLLADLLLDHCQTPEDHPWPKVLVTVPTKGKPYGACDPHGYIQLDILSEVGLGMLQAYQLTGNTRYFEGAKHWADVLAQKCNKTPGAQPWGRYANPEDVPWDGKMTGGVSFILSFLDELIGLGYSGKNNEIVEARDAGRAYLGSTLLPAWSTDETWGRNYWDWVDYTQAINVTRVAACYFMDNKDYFPNWANDVRNMLSLFLNHASVVAGGEGETHSGAWAYPESSSCCGSSTWYGPLDMLPAYARLADETGGKWAREMARRQMILATYDIHENGFSEDNIIGGQIVNNDWFKIAVPLALYDTLATIGWMPDVFGASRENHIVRSTSVVCSVVYGDGEVSYTTFDAPAGTVDVMRLAFEPLAVKADGKDLARRSDLSANGYTVKKLSNADCMVSIRHDGFRKVVVTGSDPQVAVGHEALSYDGEWDVTQDKGDWNASTHVASSWNASATYTFTGSQIRVIGNADPLGGRADVYVDGAKQIVGIDCWSPIPLYQQVLYYKNGLENKSHQIKIVARGEANPRSGGKNVYIRGAQYSSATGNSGFGEGGGPTDTQRWVFGYTGRNDLVDSAGNKWRPGTEFVVRLEALADTVARTWWTSPAPGVSGTDAEPYKYGVHAREFIVNVTVGPGTYYVRLKFAATRLTDPRKNCITIDVVGQRRVTNLDVAATAGGTNKPVDLVFNGINPRNGVIDVKLTGGLPGVPDPEAFLQAIEVGQGSGGTGATPTTVSDAKVGTRSDGLCVVAE